LNGGMPQGTWLGLYIFIILINDLMLNVPSHKYVDDVTLTEVLARDEQSQMHNILNDLLEWSRKNMMNVNCKKTKEMLIGTIDGNSISHLQVNGQPIERVKSFKLLGVKVTDSLNWDDNTSLICSKAGKRLHFLKLIKRSGLKTDDLLYYYTAVVRPVVEYASTLWHASITQEQSDRLDTIQRRAEKIIGKECTGKLTPLKTRREEHANKFFQTLLQPTNCLHDILPELRNSEVTDRLRYATNYEIPQSRTERYKRSFLVNALSHYQI